MASSNDRYEVVRDSINTGLLLTIVFSVWAIEAKLTVLIRILSQ